MTERTWRTDSNRIYEHLEEVKRTLQWAGVSPGSKAHNLAWQLRDECDRALRAAHKEEA